MFLTIITPVYNRAALLPNCFCSLLEQTDMDFEWIIVDDGSTDDSARVAAGFQTDRFPIRLLRKENGGKHTALNAAIGHIRGDYVLFLDSDDTLTPDAVTRIKTGWSSWAQNEQVGIVTFLKGTAPDAPVCTTERFDTPVDILRSRRIRIVHTDCCEVLRAELLCRYPFPEYPGERFLAECALWNRIARTHKCVYREEIVYLCQYLEEGLTQGGRSLRIRCPQGGMFTSELRIHSNNTFSQRIKYAILYCCYGFFAGLAPQTILSRDPGCRWLKTAALLPGYLLYRRWKQHL